MSVFTVVNLKNYYFLSRLNLSSYIKKVKSLFKDDCLQKYQDVLMAAGNWNRYDRGHMDWEYTIQAHYVWSNIFDTHFIIDKGVLQLKAASKHSKGNICRWPCECCFCRVLYEMQTSLEHFGVVLRQRMGDLHVCEAQQNKVSPLLPAKGTHSLSLALFRWD